MLKIKDLYKSYEDKDVLKGINLEIESGDIFGFIGKNGAGKTTTIKSIVGLIPFDKGSILINNIDVTKFPLESKKIIAYIPDNPDIYEFLLGIEYINFILDIYDIDESMRREKIEYYANKFDIYNDLNTPISNYSHGMKQKLAIIAALCHDPLLLILDEPFVGLDPTATHFLKEEFKKMCERGSAIFFSTHVLEVAQNLCNKIAILKDGEIKASGLTKDITNKDSLEKIFMELNND